MVAVSAEDRHFLLRVLLWLADRMRPPLGWAVWTGALLLMALPAQAVRYARWVDVRRARVDLEWVGPVSLVVAWTLAALCLRVARRSPRSWLRALAQTNATLLWGVAGVVTVSQVLVHWIPGPGDLWRAERSGNWLAVVDGVRADWLSLLWRYSEWWSGVQTGGAFQDDLVFLSFLAVFLWLLGGVTVWLAFRTRRGLLLSLPALWVLALFLFYGGQQRIALVLALGLAFCLHILLDHRGLEARWRRSGIDFSPMLLADRFLAVAGVGIFVLALALFTPNLAVNRIAIPVYRTLSPFYDSVDGLTERLFPDLKGGRRGYGRLSGGLPNRFLLSGGPELGTLEVMRVTTSQPFGMSGEAPPRVYMRRGTFVNYNGRGWDNPRDLERETFDANRRWRAGEWTGRALLVQRVRLTSPSALLYAAGEPLEPRIDYELDRRAPDDLVAVWSQAGPVTRYDVVSAIPAVDASALRSWPGWSAENPRPEGLDAHLALPGTITQRTRDLAAQFRTPGASPYAIAESIEAFLRNYPYDLDVPGPPRGVDVADFFLFDLGRGYCDYYATAFVVLARLNGLPTRFATGYISANWDPENGEWTITEAEAHSWPEVYFPEIGWIPFEPTAGRPALQRFSLPERTSGPLETPPVPVPEEEEAAPGWNWQMLVWLLPVLAVLWFAWRALERRHPRDPWLGLVAWGRRLGRPYNVTETEREYGAGLAVHLDAHETEPERRRRLVRNVTGLAEAVSEARYATEPVRDQAADRADSYWQAIRRDMRRFW